MILFNMHQINLITGSMSYTEDKEYTDLFHYFNTIDILNRNGYAHGFMYVASPKALEQLKRTFKK